MIIFINDLLVEAAESRTFHQNKGLAGFRDSLLLVFVLGGALRNQEPVKNISFVGNVFVALG